MKRSSSRGTAPVGWRERISIFLLFSAALLSIEIGHGIYQWLAFGEERTQLRVLGGMAEAAGTEVVRSQLRVDSLRVRIQTMDHALGEARVAFDEYGRRSTSDYALRAGLYSAYRSEVTEYNRQVAVRNAWFGRWQQAVDENRSAVSRYNRLADEIRSIALRMGEYHYNVPSPVEAAVRSGLGKR